MENRKILAINPGSTSTKIAVFNNTQSVFLKNLRHSAEELQRYDRITDQFEFRKGLVLNEIQKEKIDSENIRAVIGRGGLLRPIQSGVYRVTEKMKEDLLSCKFGEHASNLGGLIADSIASALPQSIALIADPVVVDEMLDVARISGHPLFERKSIFHALNQKAVARTYAQSINMNYEDMNLIVAHMGGGISIGVHCRGKVIDVNQALDGEGPFSPERSGTLPMGDLIKLCFEGKFDHKTLKKMITGEGGFVAWLGTNDAYQVELMVRNGNEKARLLQDALAYQVSKYIGASAAVLKGNVDAIILTGGIAHSKTITGYISEHTSFIAPVIIFPGEDEMRALANNALLVLDNKVKCLDY